MIQLEHTNAICVSMGVELSPMGKRVLDEYEAKCNGNIDHFSEQEMQVNVMEHDWVPLHVPLTQTEKLQLLRRYGLQPTQLPRIQKTDAVSRFLGGCHAQVAVWCEAWINSRLYLSAGLRPGMVVKIIRESETAGRYITYRLVI